SLRAWRRGARHGRRRPRRRQEVAPLQAARLRDADRAGRERVSGVAGAVVVFPDSGDSAPGAHGGRADESDRRRDREAPDADARCARDGPIDQYDRSVVPQAHGADRRLRRQSRPAQRVLHDDGRPRLLQRGSGALPLDVAVRRARGRREVPIAQVNLVVLSGTGDDPAGKFGIASLTAALLTEGAGSRSALQIADAVDFLGADLVTNAGSDGSAVRLNVPVARLADALPIMADVALRP